jgi:hypothetical protein
MINIVGDLGGISSGSSVIRNLSLGLGAINAPYRIVDNADDSFVFNDIRYGTGCVPSLSVNYKNIPGSIYDKIKDSKKILSLNNYTHNLLINNGFENSVLFKAPLTLSKKRILVKERAYFNFLSVININKCYHWDKIVRSFFKTFKSSDDVCLILKIYAGNNFSIHSQSHIINMIQKIKSEYQDVAPVVFIGSKMSDKDFSSLYNVADCFVKLEGVDAGLSFLNAMASNLVCIGPSTGVGGDIIKKYGGIPIDKKSSIKNVYDPFLRGSVYDLYSENHLCSAMEYVFNNFDEVKEKNLKNRKTIFNEYSINSAVYDFLNIYKDIFGKVQ